MMRPILGGILLAVCALGCKREVADRLHEDRVVSIQSTLPSEDNAPQGVAGRGLALPTTALTDVRFLKIDATSLPSNMGGATVFLGNRATNGDITWTTTPKPTYDKSDQTAYFVGYHPSTGTSVDSEDTSGGIITWNIDGKTDLLVSSIWSAGKYTLPNTGMPKLTFEHVLAQLAVICKAESGADMNKLKAAYGKIESISFKDAYPNAFYVYSTNEVTFGGSTRDIKLRKSDCEAEFTAIDLPTATNTTVNAAGLFAPNEDGKFTLVIHTDKVVNHPNQGDKLKIEVDVELKQSSTPKPFEKGLKHTVTLTFMKDYISVKVTKADIVAWSSGGNFPDQEI